MTMRNLNVLFQPRSVILVGAGDRPGSIGLHVAENLLRGGFAGEIAFVYPSHDTVQAGLATAAWIHFPLPAHSISIVSSCRIAAGSVTAAVMASAASAKAAPTVGPAPCMLRSESAGSRIALNSVSSLASSLSAKSCTFTRCGSPLGR